MKAIGMKIKAYVDVPVGEELVVLREACDLREIRDIADGNEED